MGVELKVLLINLGSNRPWDVKMVSHYTPQNYTPRDRWERCQDFPDNKWQEVISSSTCEDEAGRAAHKESHQQKVSQHWQLGCVCSGYQGLLASKPVSNTQGGRSLPELIWAHSTPQPLGCSTAMQNKSLEMVMSCRPDTAATGVSVWLRWGLFLAREPGEMMEKQELNLTFHSPVQPTLPHLLQVWSDGMSWHRFLT